jgi:hypothetical protein
MVRSKHPDKELKGLLDGPAGALIREASQVMQDLKLGFRIELSEVPADVHAVICCIDRETNKHQAELAEKRT